jgi:hypothetical protein
MSANQHHVLVTAVNDDSIDVIEGNAAGGGIRFSPGKSRATYNQGCYRYSGS